MWIHGCCWMVLYVKINKEIVVVDFNVVIVGVLIFNILIVIILLFWFLELNVLVCKRLL